MKKLCFITTVPITMQAFVVDTAEYLSANAAFDVTLICDYDEDFEASLPPHIHYIPVSMKRGIDFGGVATVFRMWKILRRERFDLVQYSTPNAALYASIAATAARVPVRLYAQWGVMYAGLTGWQRKVFKTLERVTCALSSTIEPDSHGHLLFCQREGLYPATKSYVLWNGSSRGVDLGRFDIVRRPEWRREIRQSLGLPLDAFVFGFVGRITRDKGVDELLGAFQELLCARPNSRLIMVGDPDGTDSVDAGLQEWAVREQRVTFCGHVSDVEKYLAAMDVLVLPSYRDGIPCAIIEAEVMGTPVIVTDIPGPTDAVVRNETGLLVQKQSVSSLLEAMEMMVSNEYLSTTMGRSAHEFAARNFDHGVLMGYVLEDRKRLLGLS